MSLGITLPAGHEPTAAEYAAIISKIDVNSSFYGTSNQAVTSGSDTTTSSSFVAMAGTGSVTSFSFTKVLSTTRVVLRIRGNWQNATAVSDASFGMRINGTDYECDRQSLNTTTNIGRFDGFAVVPSGLAAGTYTVQAVWKRRSGTGTPTRSSTEWLSIEAKEVD